LRIFDFNTFEIEVDSTLNLSDFKVVNQNSGKVIFSNSKNQKGIKNEYGRCSFELFWKENLYMNLDILNLITGIQIIIN
jgi:hypothetical protein